MPQSRSPSQLLTAGAAALKKDNPGMSLRAVAAKLNISPSYWSKILRGEKPLTGALLPRVIKTLKFDVQQVADLQRAMLRTIEKNELAPATGLQTQDEKNFSPASSFSNLGQKEFWLLEQWYYIPILNFFTLGNSVATPEEISRRLQLTPTQAVAATRRLAEAGFLTQTAEGLVRTELQVRFPTDRSHVSVRQYHRGMIEKARDVLVREDAAETFERRLMAAVCFGGDSAKLREARLILEEAMYKAATLMANEPVSDEVYQLNVQIFPLTR